MRVTLQFQLLLPGHFNLERRSNNLAKLNRLVQRIAVHVSDTQIIVSRDSAHGSVLDHAKLFEVYDPFPGSAHSRSALHVVGLGFVDASVPADSRDLVLDDCVEAHGLGIAEHVGLHWGYLIGSRVSLADFMVCIRKVSFL